MGTERIVNTVTGEIFESHIEPDGGADVVLEPATDEWLIEVLSGAQLNAQDATRQVGHIEQELLRRAKERGATTIYGKDMKFVVTQKPDYARDRLHPLLELLDPDQRLECYTPEGFYETWHEAKWDMIKVKKHARARGKEALDIVAKATFPGPASGKLVTGD